MSAKQTDIHFIFEKYNNIYYIVILLLLFPFGALSKNLIPFSFVVNAVTQNNRNDYYILQKTIKFHVKVKLEVPTCIKCNVMYEHIFRPLPSIGLGFKKYRTRPLIAYWIRNQRI